MYFSTSKGWKNFFAEFEPFESIPLSQTDAFIDSVDIDQLFSKEKISEVKTNTSKPTTSTGKKTK